MQYSTQGIAAAATAETIGQAIFNRLLGEPLPTFYQYPPGDGRRYNIFPNDGVDHEASGEAEKWKAACCLPGVEGMLVPGYYPWGWSTSPWFSGMKARLHGCSFGNVVHIIAGGTQATGTVTLSAGAVSGDPTVSVKGGGYFHAPGCWVGASSGGSVLRGVVLTPVMEADTVALRINGGSNYAVNDTITLENGVVVTVTSVSAGAVTGNSITTRGTIADPSVDSATGLPLYGNQYAQVSTSGSGSGYRALLGFRVASITTTTAGSGGPATGTLLIDVPRIEKVCITGDFETYGRLGLSSAFNCKLGRVTAINNTLLNTQGNGQPGGHWDYVDNVEMISYECRATVDGVGFQGSAGLAIGSSNLRMSRNVTIGKVTCNSSDANGFVAQCANIHVGQVLLHGWGKTAAIQSTQYVGSNGANSEAHGYFFHRCTGYIGPITPVQNDQTIGASAAYHGLVNSTGDQVGASNTVPIYFEDSLDPISVPKNFRGLDIAGIKAWNISRKGVGFGDRVNGDTSAGLNVRVLGTIEWSASATIAQTANYQAVHVNNPAGGNSIRVRLAHGGIVGQNTGTMSGFFADTLTLVTGDQYYPVHGSGVLVDLNGIYRGDITFDGDGNLNMPSSTNDMLRMTGGYAARSRVNVIADCGSQNVAGRTIVNLDTVRGAEISVRSRHYRNVTGLVKLSARSATVTMTQASPCVVTDTGHKYAEGQSIILTTTGALLTGLTAGATVYVKSPVAGVSYNLSATRGGTAINTTGTQSGTHTAKGATEGVIINAVDITGKAGSENGLSLAGRIEDCAFNNGVIASCGGKGVTASSVTFLRCSASNWNVDASNATPTDIANGVSGLTLSNASSFTL